MSHLKFAHIEYSISTRSLDIFVVGCAANPPCKDCCNPEIRDFNLKGGYSTPTIIAKIAQLDMKYGNLIDKLILVGGDFCDNYKIYKDETTEFLIQLKEITSKPLFLFTRYELDDIPKSLLELIDYVKTGAYIPELKTNDNIQEGIKLATSNQQIFKVSEILEKVNA